jgi:phage tail sheath protein FI
MFSSGRTPASSRYTITERAVFYHVSRDLFVTTRPFIFRSISSRRLGEVSRDLRTKLRVYWQDGWFSDALGPGFEQQVSVAVPPELNTPASLQEGNVTATIEFQPRPALERLKIIISPTQLTSES